MALSGEGSTTASVIAAWNAQRQQAHRAALVGSIANPVFAPSEDFPVLLTKSVIIPYQAPRHFGELRPSLLRAHTQFVAAE